MTEDMNRLAQDAYLARERAIEDAARRVVAWIDGGGQLGPWPNSSGLNDLRAALDPQSMVERRYLVCERNESSASAHGHTDDCYLDQRGTR
jgi:hypothetical protein